MHDLRLLVTGFLDTSDFCFFIAAWEALVPEADVGHKVPHLFKNTFQTTTVWELHRLQRIMFLRLEAAQNFLSPFLSPPKHNQHSP
jgi:hypothetical protein